MSAATAATTAPRVRRTPLRRALDAPLWLRAVAGLSALTGLSLALRTTAIHAGFWIDEGLSVGISHHGFLDIPGVLRQDGSPPLYYMLLHVWMAVFGDGQATTHALSVAFAVLTVPIGFWAGWSLFGVRAGTICALLFALNPFLTFYAQETRMYALVCLLSLLVAAFWTHAFVFRRRGYLVGFALALAALIYTHNWGLFLGAGSVVALAPVLYAEHDRRGLVRDALLAYGGVGLLYLPWVPTLLFQAAHTGAPWSERPGLTDVFDPISSILGGKVVPLGLLLAAGAGLATIAKEPIVDGATRNLPAPRPRRVAVQALSTLPLAGLALAWTASQVSPAFTGRYLATFVGPALLLAGIGLAHAGRLGIIALLIILAMWFDPRTSQVNGKSDARLVAAKIRNSVSDGDLVISVHPETAPLLHYYFPPGLRWATALGPMPDTGIFDWRDALDRLRAAKPRRTLATLVDPMRPGQTVVLVLPIIRTGRWGAPWTALVRKRSAQWQRAADKDPRLVRLAAEPRFGHRHLPRGVRAVLYRVRSVPRG